MEEIFKKIQDMSVKKKEKYWKAQSSDNNQTNRDQIRKFQLNRIDFP